MKRWLVLDCHYLCYRAYHSTKDLSFKSKSTGVIFGFLKSIIAFKDEFETDDIVFCFEHPKLHRRAIYPPYKRNRNKKPKTAEEKASFQALAIQIKELMHRYLPKIGFKNIFSLYGMESDDTMAQIAAWQSKDKNEVILVTADNDLFQCLGPRVSIYSPHKRKLLSDQWFFNQYRIRPPQWALVKAIAGCSSDGVEGIKGVGEITALRYLRGELKRDSQAYKAIRSAEGRAIVRRNRALVELPYRGCPVPVLAEDEISRAGWIEVCATLGMKSLANHPPVATRKRGQYE